MGGGIVLKQLSEFYRQLALLVDSGLPLPESVLALSKTLGDEKFRRALASVASSISGGRTLSEAMSQHPSLFPEGQIKTLQGAESSELLSEVLDGLAAQALLERELLSKLFQLVLIPSITCFLAIDIAFGILYFIVPKFSLIFNELLEGAKLPPLTECVLAAGCFVHDYPWPFIFLLLVLKLVVVGRLLGWRPLTRIFLSFLQVLPVVSNALESLAWSKAALALSVLFRRGMTFDDALATASICSGHGPVSKTLLEVRVLCLSGFTPLDSLNSVKRLPGVFKLAFSRASAGGDLADEMDGVAELQLHLGRSLISRWLLIAEILAVVISVFTVFAVVIGMFMPLISIIEKLGGA